MTQVISHCGECVHVPEGVRLPVCSVSELQRVQGDIRPDDVLSRAREGLVEQQDWGGGPHVNLFTCAREGVISRPHVPVDMSQRGCLVRRERSATSVTPHTSVHRVRAVQTVVSLCLGHKVAHSCLHDPYFIYSQGQVTFCATSMCFIDFGLSCT